MANMNRHKFAESALSVVHPACESLSASQYLLQYNILFGKDHTMKEIHILHKINNTHKIITSYTINPYNLKDQKYGIAKVAIAGPLANFSIALLFGIFLRFTSILTLPLSLIVYINIFLGLFNLLPFPPLDGSKLAMVFFPELERNLSSLGFLGIFLAIIFALFILSPLSNLIYYLIVGQPFAFF